MVRRLTSPEFYTTYGVSLLADVAEKADKEFLAALLQPIAERYRDITLYALRDEMEHLNGCTHDSEKWLAKIGIKKDYVSNEAIHKMDIDALVFLFMKPSWCEEYGGKKWGEIAKACRTLTNLLPVTRTNLKRVVSAIDRLNDLEHNSALYLAEFSTFDLGDALNTKAHKNIEARGIFAESCVDIRKMAKQYRGLLR